MSVEQLMERFMEAAEGGESAEGPVGGMVIGGVDLRELQAAHGQHPALSRWLNMTVRLIPDFYETQEALQGTIRDLEAVALQQAKRIKELEEKYEPKTAESKPEV